MGKRSKVPAIPSSESSGREVWRECSSRSSELRARVALKVMSPWLNSDPSFTTRFIREARIVAHIHHASIVRSTTWANATFHYLSMEYLPGGDLKQRILRGGASRSSSSTAVRDSGALDVAHRKGFVIATSSPRTSCFAKTARRPHGFRNRARAGSGRVADRRRNDRRNAELHEPGTGQGHRARCRSDLYSLGIVCYEMLDRYGAVQRGLLDVRRHSSI